MLNRSRRLVVLVALVAMAALVAVVPVHHAHMVHLALADGAEPSNSAIHEKSDCHHGDSRHDHAGHQEFEMPRCPVCATAQAAVLPLPTGEVAFMVAAGRKVSHPSTVTLEVAHLHFRPVQPRAPPIAA